MYKEEIKDQNEQLTNKINKIDDKIFLLDNKNDSIIANVNGLCNGQ